MSENDAGTGFSGDMAKLQQQAGACREGEDRRRAVLSELRAEPGDVVLDVGCGAGFLLADIAALGVPDLRIVGLDPAPDQVAAAEATCAGLEGVEVRAGDARDLDLGDGELAFVSSIHVLEYVAEIDQALAEMARVTRPGGRVAFVSVLWDEWRFFGADEALTAEVLDVFRAHCHHQNLPAEMPARLAAAGFADVEQRALGFYNNSFDPAHYAAPARLIAATFAKLAGMDADRVDRWLDQLAAAETEGRFGFASMPVLSAATRR